MTDHFSKSGQPSGRCSRPRRQPVTPWPAARRGWRARLRLDADAVGPLDVAAQDGPHDADEEHAAGHVAHQRVGPVHVAVQELGALGQLVVDLEHRGDGEQHQEAEVDQRVHDAGGRVAQQRLHVDAGAEVAGGGGRCAGWSTGRRGRPAQLRTRLAKLTARRAGRSAARCRRRPSTPRMLPKTSRWTGEVVCWKTVAACPTAVITIRTPARTTWCGEISGRAPPGALGCSRARTYRTRPSGAESSAPPGSDRYRTVTTGRRAPRARLRQMTYVCLSSGEPARNAPPYGRQG